MAFRAQLTNGSIDVDGDILPGVTVGDSEIVVAASPLTIPERYVYTSGSEVQVAERVGDLDASLVASPEGVSQLLTLGVIANPGSALDGVFRLTSGDVVTVSGSPSGVETTTSNEYRWNSASSRNDEEPSTTRLRELIAHATDEQVRAGGGDAALMLSSGKDSVALAVALADSGNQQVPCFTFTAHGGDREHLYAAQLCKRLGLTHHAVSPDDPAAMKAALMRFFEESSQPTADLSIIPSMMIAERVGYGTGGLMDGTGNDPYMGWMPTGRNRLKWNLRVRNRKVATAINRRLPIDSGLNYFTRSPHGTLITLRLFRPHDLTRFYPEAVDPDDVWYGLPAVNDDVAWGSEVMRLQVECRSLPKVLRTAEAAHLTAILPFRDEAVADYYLNLPEASRIDRNEGTNKVLIRQMLAEAIQYDEAAVGANWFNFDGQRFLLEHAEWVRDEILGCALWSADIEAFLGRLMKQLPRRGLLHHALHALFIVSGWHNHSRYVTHK